MEHIAHSDWMFDHSLGHHTNTSADPHAAISTDTSQGTQTTQTDPAVSVAKTLWHHTDGGSSSTQGSNGSPVSSNSSSSTASPTLTVTNNALTVNAGGSVTLPISVSADASWVTIAGLTHYETVTDSLGKTFTPDAHGSITLSAADANNGLSLNSNPSPGLAAQHPVNTLTVTASETVGGHTLTSASQSITVTDPPASSGSSSSNTLTLQVSGDQYNGDPQIEVFVDGQQIGGTYTVTADHASGQTQTITITGNFDPTSAHQVQVQFVNDAWDGTSWWSNGGTADGHDRNVYVESISLNGQTLNGSQGTDAATNGGIPAANANEAVMDVNGTLAFNVPADPPATTSTSASGASTSSTATTGTTSSSSNTLTLQVSGDQYNGDPQIEVFVDGQQIGGTYTVTADHVSGQTQTITITGNFDPTSAHQVQVQFVNDAWDGTSWWSNGGTADGHDRNVYVESISLNGQTLNGSQGTDTATNGGVPAANANEAVMDVNGTLAFNVPADPPATSGNSASTTTTGGSGSSANSTGTASGAGSGTTTPASTNSTGTGSSAGSGTTSLASTTGNGGLPAHIAGELLQQDGGGNDTSLSVALSNTSGLNYMSWFAAVGLGDGTGHLQMADTYAGMATDIANYEKAGGHVTLSLGGSASDPGQSDALLLTNSTQLMNMYNDIKALSTKYGFQGIDWDLEDNTPGEQYTVALTAQLFQMLKTPTPGTPFGPNFSITLDPAPYQIRSPDGLMAQLYAAAAPNIDLVAPQFYGQPGQSDSWFLNQYIMPAIAGMTTLAEQSPGLVDIPASKIVLLCADSTGDQGTPGGAAAYLNDYQVATQTYPALRGLLWFNTESDQALNWVFGHSAAGVVGA
jgi:hypothetical protein